MVRAIICLILSQILCYIKWNKLNFVWLFNFILYIFEDIRYTELSLLRVIFDVYTCKHFRPVMNSPEHISTIVVIWDIGIRLVLN